MRGFESKEVGGEKGGREEKKNKGVKEMVKKEKELMVQGKSPVRVKLGKRIKEEEKAVKQCEKKMY